MYRVVPRDFYLQADVIDLCRQLLGKLLVSKVNNEPRTSGIIVETEAYAGPEDKASHAYNNKYTKRTKSMFQEGGHAYVYLCYGVHALFNIITNTDQVPHAILVRAIAPQEGAEVMQQRRVKPKIDRSLTGGPGSLTKAMNITTQDNETDLVTSNKIWLEESGIHYQPKDIIESPRVGIAYAEEYVDKPWRFRVKDSLWTSPAK